MYSQAEHAAITHLLKHRLVGLCDKNMLGTAACIDISASTHTGGTTVRSVMARLPKESLKQLYKGAKSGSLDSMSVISMLYLVGFGVESNEIKSLDWMKFSLLEPGSVTFEEALTELRSDIKGFKFKLDSDDYVYPKSRNILASKLSDMLGYESTSMSEIKDKLKKYNPFLSLSPVLAGVKIVLIYKVSGNKNKDCYLFDAFIQEGDNQRFTLEALAKLSIPSVLGELRRKQTMIDYPKVMGVTSKAKYFAVSGVLAVPTSRKKNLRTHFPAVTNTLGLVDLLISTAGNPRRKFVSSDEEILKLKSEARVLRNQADKYKKRGKKVPQKLKNEFAEIKEQANSIIKQDAHRKKELELSYPENYLEFVASEIVGVSKSSKVFRLSVQPTTLNTHLSSLGFKTLSHAAVGLNLAGCTLNELTEKRMQSLVREMLSIYKGEYKIGGVLIQPNDTVDLTNPKKRRRFVYKIVQS